jgi:hypothetical protein
MNEATIGSLDLETLSTRPDACVIAIGVVLYLPEPSPGFSNFITGRWLIQPDLAIGHRDPQTENWWKQQDEEVRKLVFSGRSTTAEVLRDFQAFCRLHGSNKDFQWWADPAHFDFPILENQFHLLGYEVPWNYRQKRCLMTLSRELRDVGFPDLTVPSQLHHEPVSDALAQLQELLKYRELLKVRGG